MKMVSIALICTIVVLIGCNFIAEYWHFKSLSNTKSNDAWYSSSWIRSPVTNFMLSGHAYLEYSKPNGVGNELWHIREVKYNGTTFWTTLSREPIASEPKDNKSSPRGSM